MQWTFDQVQFFCVFLHSMGKFGQHSFSLFQYFRDIETANHVTKAVSKMQCQRSNDSKTIELEFQHSREFHLTSSIERRQGELT